MSHDSRVAALDGLLEEAGLDAVLATKDASIAYLTGFWGLQMERFFGVAVKRGGDGRADRAVTGPRERRRRADRRSSATLYSAGVSNGLPELFATLDGAKRIGVEEDHLNFARSQRAAARPATSSSPRPTLIMHLRAAKDAEEVEAVRRACEHIEAAYDELWAELRSATTEAEINARVAYSLMPPRRDARRAAHPLRRPRRRPARLARASACSSPATSSSPTSPRSSTATGAT